MDAGDAMKKTLITLVTMGMVAASLTLVPSPPSAHADGFQNCADYEFVAVRGSGEQSSDPTSPYGYDPKWDGAGQTLKFAYDALHKQLDHMGYTSALDAVDYQAIALKTTEQVEGASTNTGPYTSSVGDGVDKLTQAIGNVQEQCPTSKIILGGYSQGAQVIDETLDMKTHGIYDTISAESYVLWENAHYTPLSSETANSIAGVLLYGDPKFNASDTTVNDSNADADHHGVWLLHSKWDTKLDNASTKVVSDCHLADPVCNSRKDTVFAGTHHTVADAAWVYAVQQALGDDPAGNLLGLPHTTYWTDAYKSVNDLLTTMGLPVVSSRSLGVTDDLPTDTAYLIDSRADMWRADPNSSAPGAEGAPATYMDTVATAIDDQIRKQQDRDANERWMTQMYYPASHTSMEQRVKQPRPGYIGSFPELNDMSRDWYDDVFAPQIREVESQDGGPAASGITDQGYFFDSSDYTLPTTLNDQLLTTANVFAAADASRNNRILPQVGFPIGAIPGHRKRIVIVSDRPNDLAASLSVAIPENNWDTETWSQASVVSYLVQLGISVSYWDPTGDSSSKASPLLGKSADGAVSTQDTSAQSVRLDRATAVTDSDATADSPSSAEVAAATHGTVVDSPDGLNDINAYAAQQPVNQINAPVSAFTGEAVSATSANVVGDGSDALQHTDWTVTGPDGSVVDTETTSGSDPLRFTPVSAGQYTIASEITLESGFSGTASRSVNVTEAPTAAPGAPEVSASVDEKNDVTLAWPATANTNYYTVYNADGAVVDRINPIVDADGNLHWSQTLTDQSGDVSYTVSATNDVGAGAKSVPATTTLHDLPPDRPTVTGSVDEANTVTLTWAAMDRATTYTVYDSGHNPVAHVDADGAADLTWSQTLSDQTGTLSYYVSARSAGGESEPSAAARVVLHNLHPAPANVPDATGTPAYSGDVDDNGIPVDSAAATTEALRDACASGAPSVGYASAGGPFSTQSVTEAGPNSIVVDFTATNQQLCELYTFGGLPAGEFENLPLSVDQAFGNYTVLTDATATYRAPTSAYLSVGPASDDLSATRSFSVLMNFDSTFDASAQTSQLQSELDEGGYGWMVWLGIGHDVAWIFQDQDQGGTT